MPPKPIAHELEPVEDFLVARGIESLANELVKGHNGELIPLHEALACGPARTSIDSIIAERRETALELGVKDIDVLPAVRRHIDKLGEEAQNATQAPAPAGAGKK